MSCSTLSFRPLRTYQPSIATASPMSSHSCGSGTAVTEGLVPGVVSPTSSTSRSNRSPRAWSCLSNSSWRGLTSTSMDEKGVTMLCLVAMACNWSSVLSARRLAHWRYIASRMTRRAAKGAKNKDPSSMSDRSLSGRADLNRRPQRPERCALPSYATPRFSSIIPRTTAFANTALGTGGAFASG